MRHTRKGGIGYSISQDRQLIQAQEGSRFWSPISRYPYHRSRSRSRPHSTILYLVLRSNIVRACRLDGQIAAATQPHTKVSLPNAKPGRCRCQGVKR